ncbi:MAG: biotin--[acetyl-CoA-carboxylase] ligase [Eubacterium sp.]|nr:biotin--[acetyl-CoA-carboxylase] ligase [Eubacterium sp.]
MSVKSDVLRLLESHRSEDLSGQQIAELLGVSRTAIWKAVRSLEEDGYEIKAANNRGYRLTENNDVLSEAGVRLKLEEPYAGGEIVVLKQTDSTNQEVKRRALDGAEDGLIVIAEEQTAGKGRKGRNFYSPKGPGIYMSMLFRPQGKKAENVVLITTATSVAICRAIRKVFHEEPQIKWVNDVYFRGKKICGILTEAVSDFETGGIDVVVVGIGINYKEPNGGFPEEIRETAGAICDANECVPRNDLVAAVINELYCLYDELEEKKFMDDYRKMSNVIGKEVRFSTGYESVAPEESAWEYGKAVDIDEDGGLVVEVNGEKKVLRTGEITLRVCK